MDRGGWALIAIAVLLGGCGLLLDTEARWEDENDAGAAPADGGTQRRSDAGGSDGSTAARDALVLPTADASTDGSGADASRADASRADAAVGGTFPADLGEGCTDGGDESCDSRLCRTSHDGYFCYYTSCTMACSSNAECEAAAMFLGYDGREGRCNTAAAPFYCDFGRIPLGDAVCE